MKRLNDNYANCLTDGTNTTNTATIKIKTSGLAEELATSDLIDTACKKLSLLNNANYQQKPLAGGQQPLYTNGLTSLNGYQVGYQQQQQRQNNRKTSILSTASSVNLVTNVPKNYYLKNQQHQRAPFSPSEKSKLLEHHDQPRYNPIPIRYIIVVMSTLATFVSYTIRVNMSVTLVAMVNQSNKEPLVHRSLSSNSQQQQSIELAISQEAMAVPYQLSKQSGSLPEATLEPTRLNLSPDILVAAKSSNASNGLDWSESMQGVALGAFYWGFILTHVLGGQLANIFSARIICACSILTASLLTLILPMAANFSVYWVILLRVVTGLCLGIVAPALYTLSSRWVPKSERSTSIAIRMIGGNMGAVTAMSISGYLSDITGWESVFYVIGGFGCLVFLFWIYLVSDSPQQHRWISESELNFIEAETDCMSSSQAKSIKLDVVAMISSPQLWAVAIAKFCGSWGNLMLMQKLPTYLEKVLQMPIGKNGLVNAMVYVAMSVSLFVFGLLSDYVCTNQPRSQRTTTRVLFELVALLGPAICLAFVPFVGHSADTVIALLILSMILYGLTAGGDNPIVVEIAPDFPGTMYGVTNAIASVPGFMAPILVGFMLDSEVSSSQHQWNMIFFITAAIYALGAIVFMLMADADVQPWGVADFRKKAFLEKRRLWREQQQLENSNYNYYHDYDDSDFAHIDADNHSDLAKDTHTLLDAEAGLLNQEVASISSALNSDYNNNNSHYRDRQPQRRGSRFENSINLLEQHHFNIGSFSQQSLRVRNI